MNYLKNSKFYLSGPIEFGNEINWRKDVIENLKVKFSINVFDPFSDPKQQWIDKINQYKEEKNFNKLTEIANKFVRKDLTMVDRCDALIAYLPYKVPTVGTHNEIINANNMKKPIMLICPEGKENIPIWYYGFMKHEIFFNSWNEIYYYLENVNKGNLIKNSRWDFVYGVI